ncbi:hypothetical protein [Tersicoccus sp. Bi-70]|nr:hypothetical protein [Tersicoccus sp. Bi-70]
MSSIVKIFAGSNTTTFWNGNTGIFVAPNQTKYLASPSYFNKVTRS